MNASSQAHEGRSTARHTLAAAGVVLLVWTFIALVFTPQAYMLSQRSPAPLSWLQAFLANAAIFYGWALLTPLVIGLGRRWPIERYRIVRGLAIHLLASFAIALLHIAVLRYLGGVVLAGLMPPRPPAPWMALLVGYGATNVLVYCGVVAASQALTYFRRYQDRELRLVQAQLQALRVQLHPHFLFNTLNAIAELIHADPARAERTLMGLSGMLRQVLAGGHREQVPLADEIAFLRRYLDIQRSLLGDRLAVEWQVADETLGAQVPSLILQPLVENAVRHGIGPRLTGGRVRIQANRTGHTLRLAVEDDGLGLPGAGAWSPGVGLGNTGARLRHLYGQDHTMHVSRGAGDRGFLVAITFPFRTATEDR